DQAGFPVSGAVVIVEGPVDDRAAPGGAVTGEDGQYCIEGSIAGAVEMTIAAAGFAATTVRTTVAADSRIRDVSLLPSQNENVVVTATRTRRIIDDLPVRTEVVDSRHILQSGARTLADAV